MEDTLYSYWLKKFGGVCDDPDKEEGRFVEWVDSEFEGREISELTPEEIKKYE
jgi:hypothetical protein